MSPEAQLAALAQRLTALEDEREALRTLHSYGQALDAGDEDAFADCFTEDGTFTAGGRQPGHTTFALAGRDELRAFAQGHSRPPVGYHQHHVAEPVIALDGDTARVRSTMFVVMEADGVPVLRVFGRYDDTLRRCSDGRWRIARRVAAIDAMRPGLPALVGAMLAETDDPSNEE